MTTVASVSIIILWNVFASWSVMKEKALLVNGRCSQTTVENGLITSKFDIANVVLGDKAIIGKRFTATYSEANSLGGASTGLIVLPSKIAQGVSIFIWIRPTALGDYEAVTCLRDVQNMPYAELIPFPRVLGRRGEIPKLDERIDVEYQELADFASQLNLSRSTDETRALLRRHINVHDAGIVVAWAILTLGDLDGPKAKERMTSIFYERGMPLISRLAADTCLMKIDAQWANSTSRLRQIEKMLDSTGDTFLIPIAFRRILSAKSTVAIVCMNRIASSDLLESDNHLNAYLRALSEMKDRYTTSGDSKQVDEFLTSLQKSTGSLRIKKHVGLLQTKHLKTTK